jgi:UDP-glucose 4-epimerase
MSSQVLVTGAAGFIGSHVCQHLLKAGCKVTALDDLSGGFRDQVPAGATFVEGSVTDTALINRIFAGQQFDYVFHLAAYAAEGLSHFIKYFNYTNNLLGSVNLINASVNHGVKCFVFTSSIAVYGRNQLPMSEEAVPQPEDPYGIAKYAVELDLKEAHEMFGLNHVIFRPHNVYRRERHASGVLQSGLQCRRG